MKSFDSYKCSYIRFYLFENLLGVAISILKVVYGCGGVRANDVLVAIVTKLLSEYHRCDFNIAADIELFTHKLCRIYYEELVLHYIACIIDII